MTGIPHPYIDRAMKKSTPERRIRSILRSHLRAAASPGMDVSGLVTSCFEALKKQGYMNLDAILAMDLEDVPRMLESDGTACEVGG